MAACDASAVLDNGLQFEVGLSGKHGITVERYPVLFLELLQELPARC